MVPIIARLYREVYKIDRVKPSNIRFSVDLRKDNSWFNLSALAKKHGHHLTYTKGYEVSDHKVNLTLHQRG